MRSNKVLREIFWLFLGLLPINLVVLLLLHHYFFNYTGTAPLSEAFSTFEIQLHDTYIVLDPIVGFGSIIIVPLAFVYSIRMILSKFGFRWLNIIVLVFLLGADYFLFRAYSLVLEMQKVFPSYYDRFILIPFLFWFFLMLTMVALTALMWIGLKRKALE